jgi:hypothetical protein
MWPLLFLLNLIALVASPIIVLPFAIAQRIPAWLNTPDDPDVTVQGLYEPQVAAIKAKFGQRFKTWYWLGVRNQMNGLFWALAAKAPADAVCIHSTLIYPDRANMGRCSVTLAFGGKTYHEWNLVGAWSATKCWQIRVGWKLAEMNLPGPVMFVCQIKPYLTRC